MDDTRLPPLEPPRFETTPPMLFAGLQQIYAYDATAAIPSLWQTFNTFFGTIPGQIGDVAYGICTSGEEGGENFRYMAGAEVSSIDEMPPGFTSLRLPAQTYAVFRHRGHISGIKATIDQIFGIWLPSSGYRHGEMPDMIERYDNRFDPYTGTGVTEIWIPVRE